MKKSEILKRISKYTYKSSTGCIIWVGANHRGYGKVTINGKSFIVHRLVWVLLRGLIPKGLSVLHKCDVPSCCNIEHLFLGTAKVNRLDCIAKNRHAKRYSTRILSDIEVRQIRLISYRESQIQASKIFNISESLVSRIMNGSRYKDVK